MKNDLVQATNISKSFGDLKAVDNVSLQIRAGEIYGLVGSDGAGKTTTIKILSGLLHPDGGEALVLGHLPWRREKELLSRIALVMGQRYSLQWDLPATDSFAFNQAIYSIPEDDVKKRVAEYADVLDLTDLLVKPVRNLSLGEQMKMEIVGALLHQQDAGRSVSTPCGCAWDSPSSCHWRLRSPFLPRR